MQITCRPIFYWDPSCAMWVCSDICKKQKSIHKFRINNACRHFESIIMCLLAAFACSPTLMIPTENSEQLYDIIRQNLFMEIIRYSESFREIHIITSTRGYNSLISMKPYFSVLLLVTSSCTFFWLTTVSVLLSLFQVYMFVEQFH